MHPRSSAALQQRRCSAAGTGARLLHKRWPLPQPVASCRAFYLMEKKGPSAQVHVVTFILESVLKYPWSPEACGHRSNPARHQGCMAAAQAMRHMAESHGPGIHELSARLHKVLPRRACRLFPPCHLPGILLNGKKTDHMLQSIWSCFSFVVSFVKRLKKSLRDRHAAALMGNHDCLAGCQTAWLAAWLPCSMMLRPEASGPGHQPLASGIRTTAKAPVIMA